MDYHIDQARPNDVEDICAVQMAAIEREGIQDYTDKEINAWVGYIGIPHILSMIEDKGTNVFVARQKSGMVLGFCAIKGNQITDIYVDPAYLQEGIGSALLCRAEWHIMKQGARFAKLMSTLNSVGFYLEKGYNKLRRNHLAVNDEIELDMIEMHKRLRAG